MTVDFATPVLFASRCLGFTACRWDGATIRTNVIEQLKPHVKFVVHCPEVEIGLGVPRKPVRIIELDGNKELYQADTDRFFTREMANYVNKTLDELPVCDGFILKNRSPSCGPFDVKLYTGKEKKGVTRRTAGFFADEILRRWPLLALEDEGRLSNFTLRERFLNQVFALSDFRRVEQSGSVRQVVDFHTRYKLVLMACNQKEMRNLGRLVAAPKGISFADFCRDYAQGLNRALQHGPRVGSAINVLMHAQGYFKRELKWAEKEHFANLLERYRNKRVPLSVPVAVIQACIERFDQPYLRSQAFFHPYPEALVSISDSGKGLDY